MRSTPIDAASHPERPCGYLITPGCYPKVVQLGALVALVAALAVAISTSLYSVGVQRLASQATRPAALFQR